MLYKPKTELIGLLPEEMQKMQVESIWKMKCLIPIWLVQENLSNGTALLS